ncbi:MAG: MG2 domain-containing protein [Polyangiales bacterium]
MNAIARIAKPRPAHLAVALALAGACAANRRPASPHRPAQVESRAPFAPIELPPPIVIVGRDEPAVADAGVTQPPPDLSPDRTPASARQGPLGSTVLLGEPGDGAPLAAFTGPRTLHVMVDAPYESWSGEGSFVHVVAVTPAMRPCPGAEVYLGRRRMGRADEHGTFVFRPMPSADRPAAGNLDVTCRAGPSLLRGSIDYRALSRTLTFERATVFVHTDRGVYAPGDTVHVRAIAWKLRGAYEPLDAQTLGVSLSRFDPQRGSVRVTGAALRTDAYGVGAVDLALDDGTPEGAYELVATLGERTVTARLRVERARHPAIEIRATGDGFITPETASLELGVSLRAVDDAPVTRAHLAVSLAHGDVTAPAFERDLDGPGPHRVTLATEALTALRARLHEGDEAEVVLRVTDPSGRDDTLRRPLTFTAYPYELSVTMDRERHAPGEVVTLSAALLTSDRAFAPGRRLRVDGITPAVEAVTGADGRAELRFPMPAAETDVTVRVGDTAQRLWSERLRLGAAPLVSNVAEEAVRERQDVHVTVRFPSDVRPVESVVHADVTDASGAIISSFLLPLTGEAEPAAQGVFRAPSWGTMLVSLFALAAPENNPDPRYVGVVTGGQTVAVTPSTAALDVTLHGLPERVRPGERLTVSAEVRRDGALVDAELGAWFVDAAVLSLLDPLPVPPWQVFYSPDAKVLASTGAQTLTWPRLDRTWGDDRVDVCWPARFGFHEGSIRTPSRRRVYIATDSIECRGELAPVHAPSPELVVRSDFDPTTAWIPALAAPDGRATMDLVASQEITHQQLNVIASDRHGGVGVARVEVPVRQDFYVRSDVAAALREGVESTATLVARNLGAERVPARLSLSSPDLDVRPLDPLGGAVDPGASFAARFALTPRRPGVARYEVRGESPAITDVARRTLAVTPAGEPVVELREGRLAAGLPFVETVSVDGARYLTATLSVEFPTTVSLAAMLKALASQSHPGASSLAAQLFTASALCAAAPEAIESPAWREAQRVLDDSLDALRALANPDGGYAWSPGGASSLRATVWALEALDAADGGGGRADLFERIRLARAYLRAAIEAPDAWATPEIAALEGDGTRARDALRAQVCAGLIDGESARLPAVDRLAASAEALVGATDADLLARAYALRGLARRGGSFSAMTRSPRSDPPRGGEGPATDHAALARGACNRPRRSSSRAVTARRAGLVRRVGRHHRGHGHRARRAPPAGPRARPRASERGAVERALASRPSWGSAHDTRTAQWALRILARVRRGEERRGASVVVRANGHDVARVALGGDASWAAALALSRLDLTPFLAAGGRVEARYDGDLDGVASLTVRRWRDPRPSAASASGAPSGAPRTDASRR